MTLRLLRYALQSAVVACAIGLAASASAETEADPVPPRTMSLEDAFAHAKASHLRSRAARHRLAAAQRDAEVPGAQWLPRIGGMAQIVGSTVNNSTTTLLGTRAVDVPRIGATPLRSDPDFQPYPSTAVGIGVRQQLFDFGRIAAEQGAASSLAVVERHRATSAVLDVELAVASAYYTVLAAHAIDEASRAANARATAHRDLARANVRTGLRPPIELTRAEADVARYEAGMMRARASLHVARTTFAAAVGVDDVELDATPRWSEPDPLPPLERVLGRAALTPSVLEGRALAEAQRAETRRLQAQTRPDLSLTASITARAGGGPPANGPPALGAGWLPTVPNYGAGVVLTWPLVEPTWSRRAEASRAREAAFDAEAALTLQGQRALITTLYREAALAAETLDAVVRGAEAAAANYEQADRRFRVGLGTSTEVADAQALRTEAEIQLAIAKFQTARARAAFDRVAAETR